MKYRILFAVSVGLGLSAPASSQEAPAAAPAPAPVPEKKICRTITPTGSIMGKKFCLTKSEWKRLNDINAANAETGMDGRRLRAQKGGGEL